jgi:disulfide bond formation protein DsbB
MRISDRWVFCGEAVVSLGLLAGALILGELFRLHPCYWCSFQRLLCMALAFLGCCGMLLPGWRRVWALLSGLVTLGGVYAAGRQSWMQLAEDAVECGFGDPTLVERLVDWLGCLWPSMFMVTGLCKDKDWVFLGLTLANWSGIGFLMLSGASVWMLFRRSVAGDQTSYPRLRRRKFY